VGAAPVQNIGAYGTEVKDAILTVEVFDSKQLQWKVLSNSECNFSYRNSIFKLNPNRYIITSVIFKLYKVDEVSIPKYKDVLNYFNQNRQVNPSLLDIREAIISIRKSKLPDPNVIPNCGSFFKNPVISNALAEKIRRDFPNAPIFKNDINSKIPASFLIDSTGLKGETVSNIVIHPRNAVILTNPHNAQYKDLVEAKDTIINKVCDRFNIILEPEVNIIN
jgi:UDP-N-acetylmuramate dehydrogenase